MTGLDPNAIYHVRLVATNKNGSTTGTDVTFKTSRRPPPGAPTLGRTFNLAPVNGLVLIKVHGLFVPLTQLRQFPKNTEIDALGGTLRHHHRHAPGIRPATPPPRRARARARRAR